MRTRLDHLLHWAPRILSLLFAAFLALFALDVFDEHSGFWQVLGALLMHLIAPLLVLILLAISWRWPMMGGALFLLVGLAYVATASLTYAVIAVPLFLVGVLFLLDGGLVQRTQA